MRLISGIIGNLLFWWRATGTSHLSDGPPHRHLLKFNGLHTHSQITLLRGPRHRFLHTLTRMGQRGARPQSHPLQLNPFMLSRLLLRQFPLDLLHIHCLLRLHVPRSATSPHFLEETHPVAQFPRCGTWWTVRGQPFPVLRGAHDCVLSVIARSRRRRSCRIRFATGSILKHHGVDPVRWWRGMRRLGWVVGNRCWWWRGETRIFL